MGVDGPDSVWGRSERRFRLALTLDVAGRFLRRRHRVRLLAACRKVPSGAVKLALVAEQWVRECVTITHSLTCICNFLRATTDRTVAPTPPTTSKLLKLLI